MIRANDELAFPHSVELQVGDVKKSTATSLGLTKREYFAGRALQGILTALQSGVRPVDVPAVARDAIAFSDALIVELSK